MNQRIISCPSALFTKGVANTSLPRISSGASMTKNGSFKMTSNSSLSFKQQFDLKRLSASSLVSTGLSSASLASTRSPSVSAQRNATWDEVGALKQRSGNRVSLHELTALKTNDEPKIHNASLAQNSSCPSNMFLQGTNSTKAPRRTSGARAHSTLLQLSLVKEEDEALKRSVISAPQNSAWKEMIVALEISSEYPESNPQEASSTSHVDTFAKKPARQINTRYMTSGDLAALKHADPFMYYSIPAVKDATWRHKEVDMSSLQGSGNCRRKSCISFESADFDIDDLDLDDILGVSTNNGEAQGSGEEDVFLSFMERCQ